MSAPRRPSAIQVFSESADAWARRASQQPGSRGAAFYADAYAAYSEQAKRDHALSFAHDAGELVELRFIGPRAESGALPLGAFIDIVGPMNKAINTAAYKVRTGQESARVDDDVRDSIALQMAGTGYGSARVFITGDCREDLTGQNLLDSTLAQTFRLLNANEDEFYDAVDAVGGVAARHFADALKEVEKHGLSAAFSWDRPSGPLYWDGSAAEIHRVRALIEKTKEPEVFDETLTGQVATLNDAGAIHLRIDGEKVKVKFPLRLFGDVSGLHLGQTVSLPVSTAKYWHTALKRHVLTHTLRKTEQ